MFGVNIAPTIINEAKVAISCYFGIRLSASVVSSPIFLAWFLGFRRDVIKQQELSKMIVTKVDSGNQRGQWSEKNDGSAAHGGLRHKALFGSVDKQAPPVNVRPLVKNDFTKIEEDIKEFAHLAPNCEAFHKEKAHFQGVVYNGG